MNDIYTEFQNIIAEKAVITQELSDLFDRVLLEHRLEAFIIILLLIILVGMLTCWYIKYRRYMYLYRNFKGELNKDIEKFYGKY